jgi:hypothetical protein
MVPTLKVQFAARYLLDGLVCTVDQKTGEGFVRLTPIEPASDTPVTKVVGYVISEPETGPPAAYELRVRLPDGRPFLRAVRSTFPARPKKRPNFPTPTKEGPSE